MKRINRSFFILTLLSTTLTLPAQDNLVLNTPYYWLKEALKKTDLNDTAGVLLSLGNAVKFGLFDEQAIINSKKIDKLLSAQQKDIIKSGITKNRSKIQKPSAIRVITADIDRFWQLFPAIADSNAAKIFLANYIQKGSIGLQTFYQIRMSNTLAPFVSRIRSLQNYYRSIQTSTRQFEALKPQFIHAAKKLKKVYPGSIFPPIYFLIGYLNNVGTADGYAGLLIGTEHLCRHAKTDTSEMNEIDKMIIFDTSLAVPLVVHEYVHFQQKNKYEKTLLELSIMEGAADFITYLITGRYTNPDVYKFGFANEKAIWEKFAKDAQAENTDDWLFNAYNPSTGYPGNLGYFVGFRICESYYKNAGDKETAVKEMLVIKDFNQFLEKSKYVVN